jgi:hypothetical protein
VYTKERTDGYGEGKTLNAKQNCKNEQEDGKPKKTKENTNRQTIQQYTGSSILPNSIVHTAVQQDLDLSS